MKLEPPLSEPEPIDPREDSYLRLLIVLLGTATFFEGYDAAINAVVLKDLAEAFGVALDSTGRITGPIAIVGMGAFGALLVTTLGDRIGRRPLLIGTTLIYALFTGLTATAQSLSAFVIFQFIARTFLIAEYATAITIVAEEFPAARRGRAMGTLTALGAFGLPVAALANLMLHNTSLGWRALYLIGLVPLVVVGALRLKLRETTRWLQSRAAGTGLSRVPMLQAVRQADRKILWRVSALFFLSHFALLAGLAWWPYYAEVERGFSEVNKTILLAGAYPLGVPGYFLAGKLQDRYGRRPTGLVFFIAGLTFGIAVFQVSTPAVMFPLMTMAVFFGMGVSPVLNAVAAELFPTEIRATAVAFVRSIFGTLGAIIGPFTVGLMADRAAGELLPSLPFLGQLGDSVSIAILMYIPAAMMLLRLPETAGRELESISRATPAEAMG